MASSIPPLTTDAHTGRARRARRLGWLVPAAAAGLFASACATSTPYQQPVAVQPISPGPGEEIAVDRAIVLFDASGSIDAKDMFPGGKAAVESFVQGMPEGSYQAAIRSFGGDRRRGAGLAPFDRAALATTAKDLKYIGEDTPIDGALRETADSVAGQGGRTAVVLVSDGVPNKPKWGETEPVLEAGRAVAAKSGGEVCFHTVQMGEDPAGRALLESLAGVSDCGSFRTASSLGDAASISALDRDVFIARSAVPPPPPMPGDADRDGVRDNADACPGTPIGAKVDARGCWVLEGITFASGSAEVATGDGRAAIMEVAEVLAKNPDLRVRIEGHTDSQGSEAYNQNLSELRAKRVYEALQKAGIDASRLEWQGFGESNPAADNATPEGRAENRRIEFTVLR